MEKNNQVVYGIVNNIPQTYHSSDLRNFFSQFIETKGFKCFHFRHRPEKQISTKSSETENEVKTFCCVFRTVSERLDNLIRLYNKKHWLDKHGDSLSTLCYISKFSVSQNKGTCITFPVSNNNKFGWTFISCHTVHCIHVHVVCSSIWVLLVWSMIQPDIILGWTCFSNVRNYGV